MVAIPKYLDGGIGGFRMANLDSDFDLHENEMEFKCWCLPERDGDFWIHNPWGFNLRGVCWKAG